VTAYLGLIAHVSAQFKVVTELSFSFAGSSRWSQNFVDIEPVKHPQQGVATKNDEQEMERITLYGMGVNVGLSVVKVPTYGLDQVIGYSLA
jgi:hypothetical protein